MKSGKIELIKQLETHVELITFLKIVEWTQEMPDRVA
jgi:hypothetical protein